MRLCPKLHRQRATIELITNKNLYDAEMVRALFDNFLADLAAMLEMTPISELLIKYTPEGASAYLMWAESGVQIHSWWEQGLVTIDVFSVKPYYVSTILDVIDNWFEPIDVDVF